VNPERKRIIVQDSVTGARVRNVVVRSVTREAGDIVFEPVSGKGTYFIYYLPYRNEGRSNYPRGVYWRPDTTAESGWLKRAKMVSGAGRSVGIAKVVRFEAIDSFNTRYPMEVVATAKEVAGLKAQFKDSAFLVFPQNREYPIRMQKDLPYLWLEPFRGRALRGPALRGEYYAYQLGLV
jgi:hypothetical protein